MSSSKHGRDSCYLKHSAVLMMWLVAATPDSQSQVQDMSAEPGTQHAAAMFTRCDQMNKLSGALQPQEVQHCTTKCQKWSQAAPDWLRPAEKDDPSSLSQGLVREPMDENWATRGAPCKASGNVRCCSSVRTRMCPTLLILEPAAAHVHGRLTWAAWLCEVRAAALGWHTALQTVNCEHSSPLQYCAALHAWPQCFGKLLPELSF